MGKHEHVMPEPCAHEFRWCAPCLAVYCPKCDSEWVGPCTKRHAPEMLSCFQSYSDANGGGSRYIGGPSGGAFPGAVPLTDAYSRTHVGHQ